MRLVFRFRLLWLLVGIWGLFPVPLLADPPKGYPFIPFDEGLRQARAQDKPIFLYFGRYGCGWCEKTNKESFSDEDLRRLYTENYVLVYADAESGKRLTLPSGERITEMELGARMNVIATPVFLYMEPDGEVILRVPGIQTVKDFQDYHRYVSGGHYKNQQLMEFLQESS